MGQEVYRNAEQCSVAIRHPLLHHGDFMDPWCYGAGLCTLKSSKIQKLPGLENSPPWSKNICLWTILFTAQVPMRKIDSPQGQQTHHRDPLHGPSPWTMSRLTAVIERFPHRKRELSTGHVWEIAPRLLQHGANHGKREPIFINFPRAQPKIFLWNPEIVFSFQLC
jgi:hypothetical protein